jgi:hypothetical protein
MSAEILDDKRLNKQRIECKQIYFALTDPNYGWQNHPAVKMWVGYEEALVDYAIECCAAWRRRGGADNAGLEAWFLLLPEYEYVRTGEYSLPWWLGNEPFHTSHKSNLLRKDPQHYECFARVEGIQPTWSYVWPTKDLQRSGDARESYVNKHEYRSILPSDDYQYEVVKYDVNDGSQPTVISQWPRRIHTCFNTRRGAWKRVSVGRVIRGSSLGKKNVLAQFDRLQDYSYMLFTHQEDEEQKP